MDKGMQTRSRGGRPARDHSPGERVPMSFRVRPKLKEKMDQAAAENGRSVTQEIELRLENSFRDQDVMIDSLKVGFGPELAAFLLLICRRVNTISATSNFLTGNKHQDTSAWLDSPFAFAIAERSISRILNVLRPAGDPSFYNQPGIVAGDNDPTSRFDEYVTEELQSISGPPPIGHPGAHPWNAPFFELIRKLLGPERVARVRRALETEAAVQ